YVIGSGRLSSVGQKPERDVQQGTADEAAGFDFTTLGLAILGLAVGVGLGYYFGDSGFVSALFPGVVGFFAGYLIGTTRLLNGEEFRRVVGLFILLVFCILVLMTY